jgi:hypothetical protein
MIRLFKLKAFESPSEPSGWSLERYERKEQTMPTVVSPIVKMKTSKPTTKMRPFIKDKLPLAQDKDIFEKDLAPTFLRYETIRNLREDKMVRQFKKAEEELKVFPGGGEPKITIYIDQFLDSEHYEELEDILHDAIAKFGIKGHLEDHATGNEMTIMPGELKGEREHPET